MPANESRRDVEGHHRAPAPQSETSTDACGQAVTFGDDVDVIIRRAAALGIPRWRVTTALGLPLPVEPSR